MNLRILKLMAYVAVAFLYSSFVYAATRTAASCSLSAVTAAISASTPGDTVTVPAGTCSWTGGINIPTGVTVQGMGVDSTIINWVGASTAINMVGNNARLTAIRVNRTGGGGEMFAQADQVVNWRVDNSIFNNGSFSGVGNLMWNLSLANGISYTDTWGLFDHNQFINLTGENGIFKGPCNGWKAPHSKGGSANWFFESNTFTSTTSAYLDFHINARAVIRNNSVSNVYFDGHGLWSNIGECAGQGGSRGVRHMEVYNNTWSSVSDWRIVFPRGGSGMIYGNRVHSSSNKGGMLIYLEEYCVKNPNDGNCGPCPTPAQGPLKDQIGRGIDLVEAPGNGMGSQSSEPMLIWDNLYDDNTRVWMAPIEETVGFQPVCNGQKLSDFIVQGRDFCLGTGQQNTVKPTMCNGIAVDYTAFVFPHPLSKGNSSGGNDGRTIKSKPVLIKVK